MSCHMGQPRAHVTSSARDYLPQRASLPALRRAANDCKGCPLWEPATQTVFGQGPAQARMMLVGEQPGNEEDLQGQPFVGPAGRLLDRALELAAIDREEIYLTNAVKHFKFTLQGKRRLHKKPAGHEIRACLPWLHQELELVRPDVLVCLGATAAQALLGASFRVTRQRGVPVESALARCVIATVHPSAILRSRSAEERERELERFVDDLRAARAELHKPARE